jgi:Ca-activated chloride channel family protein
MSLAATRNRLGIAAVLMTLIGCGGGYAYDTSAKAPPSPAYAQPGYPMQAGMAAPAPEPQSTESFKDYGVNPFVDTQKDHLSTFSIDVDTASYSFSRRVLQRENRLPPFASVRAEEYLNSFDYGYEPPTANDGTAPFKVSFAASPSPFTPGHVFVRVGVQAKRITAAERSPVHLVYLVDTSGSMGAPDRLPLAKKSLGLLTDTLKQGDTVALCTYAGDTKIVLEPTGVEHKQKILSAIDQLGAGGSTAMASGIENAYSLAARTLVKGHVNRVVVLSDGDANVGNTNHEQLLKTIAQYKDKGITLSTVGFGSGNYKDTMMEQLADKGDGNYTYIDGEPEAQKVFGEQVDGLLQVIARDVKIQVDFDPNIVKRYRLIGYENRDIADKDFKNDKVDAGEVGAGHSVTALYDIEPVQPTLDGKTAPMTVRMRWKPARNAANGGGDTATEKEFKMPSSSISTTFEGAPENYRFAVSVAAFAEVLRHSPNAADWSFDKIGSIAAASTSQKKERVELVALVDKAAKLSGAQKPSAAIAK